MAIEQRETVRGLLIDKRALRAAVDAANQRIGILPGALLSAEQIHELMRTEGIRPEDCEFSREIIRLRYPDEAE